MPKENKTFELNDEDLEKVSGGIEYSISRVDAGDVFIDKSNHRYGYIVIETTKIVDEMTNIPCKYVDKINDQWVVSGSTIKTLKTLESKFYFSYELTGKISY